MSKSRQIISVILFLSSLSILTIKAGANSPSSWQETIITTIDPIPWTETYFLETGDVDNDGNTEILLSSYRDHHEAQIQLYNRSGAIWSSEVLMTSGGRWNKVVGMAVGDANNDRQNELVYGLGTQGNSNGGTCRQMNWNGSTWVTSTVFTAIGAHCNVHEIADPDGDGQNEVVSSVDVVSYPILIEPRLFEFGIGGWSETVLSRNQMTGPVPQIKVGDADGDGLVELFRLMQPHNSTHQSYTVIDWTPSWNEDVATVLPNNAFSTLGINGAMAIDTGDPDGDGLDELVFLYWLDSDNDGRRDAWDDTVVMRIVDYDGNSWQSTDIVSYPKPGTSWPYSLSVGDADNDGEDEIYVGGEDGSISVYSYSEGSWGSENIPSTISIPWWYSVIDDVDDDGYEELLLVGRSEGGSQFALVTYKSVNQAPIATAGGPYSGDEGATIALSNASATDPDEDPLTYSWSVDNPVLCSFSDASVLNPEFLCVDNGSFIVTITASDGVNDPVSSSATVTVNNVTPAVVAGPDATINACTTFTGSGSFSDPGADTWTAIVDYGDGTAVRSLDLNVNMTFALSHTYTERGEYEVTVEVTDDDGGEGTDTLTVFVLTPQHTIEAVISYIKSIIDEDPDSDVADKMEDVQEKLVVVLEELNKEPPDNQAAVGNLEGAVGDLEAAVKDGYLDSETGDALMGKLVCIARQFAVDALDYADDHGGDQGEIDDAYNYLDEGDELRASGKYKDAVNTYKDALSKAEGAVN